MGFPNDADLDVASLGECMVEFFCEGKMGESALFNRSYGGDALNALVAAARLGSQTAFISRVGDDPFGNALLEAWEKEGVYTWWAKKIPGFNGVYFISVFGGGQREFTYYRKGSAASTMGPSDLRDIPFARFKCFLVSGISQAISETCRASVLEACRAARQAGCTVCFDPNLRPKLWSIEDAREGMKEILPYVNIVMPSLPEETRFLLGLKGEEEVSEWFLKRGIEMVVGKMGPEGAFLAQGNSLIHVAAPFQDAVDTTGAGDAFNGGFLTGLTHGMSPLDSVRLGVTVAAMKVRGRGAICALPRREDVKMHMRSLGWPTLE